MENTEIGLFSRRNSEFFFKYLRGFQNKEYCRTGKYSILIGI